MRKVVSPVVGAMALAFACAPAMATQFTYVFDSHLVNNALPSTATSGRLVSTSGTGTNSAGVQIVGAQAYTAVKSGTNVTISGSSLVVYDGGVGVVSSLYDNYNNCGTGGCGMHQIDNVGNVAGSSAYDFVQLTFSQAVTLVGMSRYAFAQTSGSTSIYDDDASYGSAATVAQIAAGNTTAPTALAALSGSATTTRTWSQFSTMLGTTLGSGTGGTGVGGCTPNATMDGSSVCYDSNTWGTSSSNSTASTTWWISAAILNPDTKSDAFKLYDFKVIYNDNRTSIVTPVPEPASWMTMIAGFGFVGAGLRRRKAAARLAAA